MCVWEWICISVRCSQVCSWLWLRVWRSRERVNRFETLRWNVEANYIWIFLATALFYFVNLSWLCISSYWQAWRCDLHLSALIYNCCRQKKKKQINTLCMFTSKCLFVLGIGKFITKTFRLCAERKYLYTYPVTGIERITRISCARSILWDSIPQFLCIFWVSSLYTYEFVAFTQYWRVRKLGFDRCFNCPVHISTSMYKQVITRNAIILNGQLPLIHTPSSDYHNPRNCLLT